MNIKPLDDRVLLEVLEEEQTSSGGIIIPDTAKERPRIGRIVAVGTDEELQEVVKEGNQVLFAKYSGDEIKVADQEMLIVSRGDILAVVE
ncbi:MAG: co-chaperone GroES [Candidatus Krumholzibacteria bacterium]|jgi:chaperonin GroES|nr:co-chaperone GroES [Candidatus Krumholzibacteria bacterium]MDP6668403.1 co-chaperone GroES [Candidatus Krumholzibacteria bacterium]MDP6797972.1 co-chaperone GroES [Candidatus Krumholzibacteria bacterium]MDP7021873.1 co-chaperone GroES [Candidatus Krumholzibacteria bacterium]